LTAAGIFPQGFFILVPSFLAAACGFHKAMKTNVFSSKTIAGVLLLVAVLLFSPIVFHGQTPPPPANAGQQTLQNG